MSINTYGKEMPQGFSLMMAQDLNTLEKFNSLTREQQARLIEQARNVNSKNEMKQIISSIQNL